MKQRRDLFILLGLFVILISFIAISPQLRPPEIAADFPTSHSQDSTGTLALYRWLGAAGYDARRLEYRDFALDEADDALIMLNPSEPISAEHANQVLAWVDQGGTLILADDQSVTFGPQNQLLDKLDVAFDVYTTTQTFELPIQEATAQQPVFTTPLVKRVLARTGRVVSVPNRNDHVALLGTNDATVIAGMKRGRGYIYLSAATYPFTNAGLRDADNAALVLNLLRRVPAGGRVQFDEYHLGYFTAPSTPSLVLGSPLGWAATYAVLASGLYLILSGRRFGRPIPLQAEVARRSSAEYVTSMADLFLRGGKREYIATHYYQAFKRKLAKRDGVSPQLDDMAFVRELARAHDLDQAALASLLARLRTARSEAALISAISEAEALTKTMR